MITPFISRPPLRVAIFHTMLLLFQVACHIRLLLEIRRFSRCHEFRFTPSLSFAAIVFGAVCRRCFAFAFFFDTVFLCQIIDVAFAFFDTLSSLIAGCFDTT